MLQQTGVSTVLPYFERWMERFPTIESLAEASEADVLVQWQGLGYYRRARLLLEGARQISSGGWPQSAGEWATIPGVGPYTAGAIASIALGQAAAIVDGNVERVYARLQADPAAGSVLKRAAWTWATAQLRADAPGDWNQALMELGATICTPLNPRCDACPIATACLARARNQTSELPTPTPKRPTIKLEFDVDVPEWNGRFGLRRIPAGEWWAGLWEFPRVARGAGSRTGTVLPPVQHVVTHHRITLYPRLVRLDEPTPELVWFAVEELDRLPLPAPQRKLLGLVRLAQQPLLDLE